MKKAVPALLAILAALTYAMSIPLAKRLMTEIPSTLLAGILYLGAGIGMSILYPIKKAIRREEEESLSKKDLKYVIGMIVLDIAAPVFLLLAVANSKASVVSLLNNFEIVATSLIALLLFKEKISGRLWCGIGLITLSSIILSLDFSEGFSFSWYSLFAIAACCCWGLENNCTRAISDKSPFQIVILKGLFSGLGALCIGLILGERTQNGLYILYGLLLGFSSYGLSVFLYVIAQRYLGASRTSSYYAVAPFLGCGLSFLFFHEVPHFTFYIALGIMIIGILMVSLDRRRMPPTDSYFTK